MGQAHHRTHRRPRGEGWWEVSCPVCGYRHETTACPTQFPMTSTPEVTLPEALSRHCHAPTAVECLAGSGCNCAAYGCTVRLDAAAYDAYARAALAARPGWRSMDSAPRDGTSVLVWSEPFTEGGNRSVGEAYFRDDEWWWACTGPDDYHCDPISETNGAVGGWQPLPPPPSAPEGST